MSTVDEGGLPFVALVNSKGKVTVPKHIRAHVGIKDGDRVEMVFVRRIPDDEPEPERVLA